MNKRNIAWAAGIFEGEGSIVIRTLRRYNREQNRCVILQVNMTDEDTVREFHNVVKLGTVRGPYHSPSRGAKRKPMWYWSSAGKEARIFLTKTLPYLMSRRKLRAQEAIAAVNLMYPPET